MEKEFENEQQEQEQERYVPRPRWQVWGARVILVLFIGLLIAYYISLARGSL